MVEKKDDRERKITPDDRLQRDRMTAEGPKPSAHDLHREQRARDSVERAGREKK